MNNSRLEIVDKSQGLEFTIATYKSLLSEYSLRAKQAEEMTNQLLQQLPLDTMTAMVKDLLDNHAETRATERSIHQQELLQTISAVITSLLATMNKVKSLEDLPCIIEAIQETDSNLASALHVMKSTQ